MALSITHAFVSAVADEGNASLVQPSNWNAAHTISGTLDLTSQVTGTLPVANGGTGITSLGAGVATFLGTPSSANLAAAVTGETGTGALVFASTPTLVTPVLGAATFTSLTGSGATVTTSTPILDLSQTWNAGAVAFTAIKLNVTNTASASTSKLFDFQVGSASYFWATPDGALVVDQQTGNVSAQALTIKYQGNLKFTVAAGAGDLGIYGAINFSTLSGSTQSLNWGGGTSVYSEATYVLALKETTHPHSLRVYNTADSNGTPTNYERGVFDWTTTANTLTIGTQKGGTGTDRNVAIVAGTGATYTFATSGTATFPGISIQNNSSFISGRFVFSSSAMVSFADAGAIVSQASGVPTFADSSLAGATGWFQWGGQKRVSADVTSTSTSMAAVTGLAVNLQASRTYSFSAHLPFTDAAAGGISVDLNYDAAQTNVIYDGYLIDYGGTPAIRGPARSSAFGAAVATSVTTGTSGVVKVKGTVTTTSTGTLTVRFSQSAANATATTIKRGAHLIVHDMP